MLIPVVLFSLLLAPLLPQKFVIIGSVRDTSGRSVPNVRISVLDENFQPIRTIFVDSSGQFFVRGLSPGRYQFRVETTGTPYQEYDTGWIELASLRVRGGGSENYPLDIVLKFKPPSARPRQAGIVFAQNVPGAARLEYERAVKNLRENKPQAALAALKKAIQIFPDYFDALELLGAEYVRSGEYEAALPVLIRAIGVNSRAPRSLYALGVAQMKLNHPAEAVESLKKSAEFDPGSANTQMMLGLALGHSLRHDEAEAAFKKALQLGGTAAAEAHFYLAGIYDKQQRYREAISELELYLKEAKDISSPERIRQMINRMKAKAGTGK